MQADDQPSTHTFRPDLEGLRGVAILLVLLFHAGLPGVGGGFVGVDVFFVLSGFLITGLLVREREGRGSIDLRAFYARRARRIVPAAVVVLVATLGLAWFFLAPLDLPRVGGDAMAVALSVGNLRFAADALDYFSAAATPSPFLHYWSLGVEEQFYLLWPALLIVAMRWGRPRMVATIALAAIIVGSFSGSLLLTDVSAPWAFYSLPTRAWQLALGGLIAVTVPWHERLPDRALAPLGWLGLGAIVAALFVIDPTTTPYPGLAALLPALGAAAVVLAGDRRWSVGPILTQRPMRFLGRISYSLYLVHWPILILPAASLALGQQLPLGERLGLVALSVVLAAGCQRWIEAPFQRGWRPSLPASRVLALAGAAIAATFVIALGASALATRSLTDEAPATDMGPEAAVDPASNAGLAGSLVDGEPIDDPAPVGVDGVPTGMGLDALLDSEMGDLSSAEAGGLDPEGAWQASHSTAAGSVPDATADATPGADLQPAPQATRAPSKGPQRLPAHVRPSLADARDDVERLQRDRCTLYFAGTEPPHCSYGDRNGKRTVALVGDSHAAQWFPALERIARQHGWRLVPFTNISCRFLDLPLIARELKREYTECEGWRTRVIARLKDLRPDLVVVVVARSMQALNAADNSPTRQGEALARFLQRIPGRKAIIVDTPQSAFDVPACLSRNRSDVRHCETPRSIAFGWRYLKLERAGAKASGATIVNLSGSICPRNPCPVVIDGMIVYRDSHHLTATFAASLADELDAGLPDLDPPQATKPSPSPAPIGTRSAPAAPPPSWRPPYAMGSPRPV